MSLSAEEVKESLEVFDINITDKDILDKLLEVAELLRYDADNVVNEWLAYQSTHSCELTVESLEKWYVEKNVEKSRLRSSKTPASSRKRKAFYTADTVGQLLDTSAVGDEEDDLLNAYGTPGRAAKPKRTPNVTPKSAVKAKAATLNISSIFSPSSLSQNATSSQKYGSRSNSGDVLVTFGSNHDQIDGHKGSKGKHTTITVDKKQNVSKTYKYMFQKLGDLSEVVDEMIASMSEIIQSQHSDEIEVFSPCLMPSQEPVWITGRICCDLGGGVGRLNPQSVILQGDRMTSYGKSVPVDLSQLEEFSLFPGQIVSMLGTNPSGDKFIAHKVYTAQPEPLPSRSQHEDSETGMIMNKQHTLGGTQWLLISSIDPLSIFIAAGPFTTSDCLSYEPLRDLIQIVKEAKPDVTILVGPMLDGKNEDIKECRVNVPFDELLQDQLNTVMEELMGCTQLVVVSSERDVSCHPVYPQPPYNITTHSKNVHFVGDPCTLRIDGLTVAVTSNDILFHLGAEEISKVKGKSDRLGRLSEHVLSQRSFYPLCPSNESVNVDLVGAEEFGALPNRPDILVLPSDLKCFVKDVNGCICVNPGRLAKGLTGGTYTRLLLRNEGDVVKNASAKVIRI